MKYKGAIANFPEEIVEKMLENQQAQGNPRNAAIFEATIGAPVRMGGFDWEHSLEGADFWWSVLSHKKFERFYEKYPTKGTLLGYRLNGKASWKQVDAVLNYAMPHMDRENDLYFTKAYMSGGLFIKVKELGVLDLWFTPVYDKPSKKAEVITHTLRCDEGTFELEVSVEGIYYRPDNSWLSPVDISDIIHSCRNQGIKASKRKDPPLKNIRCLYTVNIFKIDVGCKKGTLISEWKDVLHSYYQFIDK